MENCLADESRSDLWSLAWGRAGEKKKVWLPCRQKTTRWVEKSLQLLKRGQEILESLVPFGICSRCILCSCLDSVMGQKNVGLSSASSCVLSQGSVLWESCSSDGFNTAARRRRGWSCRRGIAKQGSRNMLLYSGNVFSCTGLFPALKAFLREALSEEQFM